MKHSPAILLICMKCIVMYVIKCLTIIVGTLQKHKWENAMTVDKYSWGYRREATMDDILSTSALITQLVVTVRCEPNCIFLN